MPQSVLLLGRELVGNGDVDIDQKIAATAPAQMGHTFAADAENRSGLGACRHIYIDVISLDERHPNDCAQSGLSNPKMDEVMQVRPDSIEARIWKQLDLDIEIAGRAAKCSGTAATRQAQPSPVVDTGRNLNCQLDFLICTAVATAVVA